MAEVITEAFRDSLLAFPFVFLIYVFMELVESARNKEKIEKALSGVYAPVFASAGGLIPECGFSLMSAKLYDNGLIRTGTLVAAFLATSDEGVIVLISSGARAASIIYLLAFKFVFACFAGTLINVILKKLDNRHVCVGGGSCVECGMHSESALECFFLHPLSHACTTFVYILIINLALGAVFLGIGEGNVYAFMDAHFAFQPLITSLIGLIPNCASSITIAEAYLNGVVGFGGLAAGLTSNAGIGLAILFRRKKNFKKAVLISVILYLSGVVTGYLSMI